MCIALHGLRRSALCTKALNCWILLRLGAKFDCVIWYESRIKFDLRFVFVCIQDVRSQINIERFTMMRGFGVPKTQLLLSVFRTKRGNPRNSQNRRSPNVDISIFTRADSVRTPWLFLKYGSTCHNHSTVSISNPGFV